ncbi:MAG: L-glutamate gamma-semialdehyde dehydrogenase [Polyangiaceae bacterium]
MFEQARTIPLPQNETVLSYAPGSKERSELKSALASMAAECPEIPHVIGGKPILEGPEYRVVMPHAHRHVLAKAHDGGANVAEQAIRAARKAAPGWAELSFESRARVFMRAAELLAGPFRMTLNAATMLGQSKTAFQAEIDSACELIDFLRLNVHFASKLTEELTSPPGVRNVLELRPLEGFVLAITPFNFTAIAGNLPAAPALMGNTVVWKPAEDQSLAAYYTMRLFEAAGLPEGVINVVYGNGKSVADRCIAERDLAAIHFTGSTSVFRSLWKAVGERIDTYATYPRLIGETGGKDFVFLHASADVEAAAVALVRGAYEFQGQKCSAASRAYVPASLWPKLKERMLEHMRAIRMGDVTDFKNFMGAVINERAYDRLSGWLGRLQADPSVEVIRAEGWSKEVGYFCGPTLVRVSDPKHAVMQEELFGPVLAVFVYEDAKAEEMLGVVDQTSPYALTGAVFAQDRAFIELALRKLRQAAGNMYVNDKPTGAVVGQQPFGGARASGTNDKAGASYNLLRFASPRTIKETYLPPRTPFYPFMTEDVL